MTTNNNENKVDEKKYELMLFKSEKNKRKKLGILWENNENLIAEEKLFYTEDDKILIKKLLYNPIPKNFRWKYYFIASGAKLEYINNKGYYDKLKKLIELYPNFPFVKTIILDLNRTFPHLPFFKKPENLKKLSNVLKCFALRNCCSIGYCQGFNYIAAQILLLQEDDESVTEEKVFWVFTKIVEDFLPFDFYLKFTGVRVDMEIMLSMLSKKLKYIDKNEELKLCLNNLISRCFISLYSEIVEKAILQNIWDAFFMYGDTILFRTFNYIAFLLCDEKFKKYNIEAVHDELTHKLHNIKSNDLLNYFLLIERNINDSYIKENRRRKKNKIYQQNSQFKESFGDNNFVCNLKSPFCFYNESINDISKFAEFKIFRKKQNTKKYDDYFADKFNSSINNNIKNEINNDKNNINDEITMDDFDDILVERMEHKCNANTTLSKE